MRRSALLPAFFTAALLLGTGSSFANDARSLALGGLAITHGQGVHGVLANPATLAHLKREKNSVHLRLGSAADLRDPGRFFETAIENSDLVENITNNVNLLESTPTGCFNFNVSADTVCLTNTEDLGENFEEVLEILNTISSNPIEVLADGQAGLAFSNTRIPFGIHFGYTLSVAGAVGASDNDMAYLGVLQNALIDGELTIGDLVNSAVSGLQILNLNTDGTLFVENPQDVLTSQFGGTLLQRLQFGISLGYSITLAGRPLDIGITPKISSITTSRAAGPIAEEFDLTTPSFTDQFNDSETNTTTFTFDLGGTYSVSDQFAFSTVVRNLIPETAPTTFDSFTVETTPQVIVGGVYKFSYVSLNADVALNAALRDGVRTQPIALGAELGQGNYSLRAGISIDNGRSADQSALTLGFGLGPIQLGARLSSLNAIQAGVQLSYSF